MTDNFEDQLRRALRPVDAPEGFTERLMRALPKRPAPATVTPIGLARPARRSTSWQNLQIPAALAASLVVGVLLGRHVANEHEQRAGLAASRELMQALRVTSQKLDIVYQAVQPPPEPVVEGQENRS